jgi:dynein heavy chain
LEGKRGQFPRFYFLSNDDLLEIIGQAKDPEPIQKHIKKIFEGTHELGITTTGRGQNKTHEISQLKCSDGETVDLRKPIVINERVETWLKLLMDGMRDSLRFIFFKFYQDNMQATKKLPEREKLQKIISSTQGQVLITCA